MKRIWLPAVLTPTAALALSAAVIILAVALFRRFFLLKIKALR